MVYTCNGILFSHKKEILPFAATQVDLEDIMLSVVTQTEKDKEILYDFTYMWNLKTSNS